MNASPALIRSNNDMGFGDVADQNVVPRAALISKYDLSFHATFAKLEGDRDGEAVRVRAQGPNAAACSNDSTAPLAGVAMIDEIELHQGS